ncbi:MAG: LysE family translocator [Pseudomonadota bacterium]
MTIETWLLYVGAVAALMSTPGPSQLLMLSNSLAHGFRRSTATAAGDLTANFFQMLLAGLGLAALISTFENALAIIKWAGVAYLLWLGAKMAFGDNGGGEKQAAKRRSLKALWLQGFVTSASNPKAVIFFAALFPQFISGAAPFWPQFAILSATYIAMDGFMLTLYGSGAGWIGERVKGAARRRLHKIGGGLMIGAAMLLAMRPVGR